MKTYLVSLRRKDTVLERAFFVQSESNLRKLLTLKKHRLSLYQALDFKLWNDDWIKIRVLDVSEVMPVQWEPEGCLKEEADKPTGLTVSKEAFNPALLDAVFVSGNQIGKSWVMKGLIEKHVAAAAEKPVLLMDTEGSFKPKTDLLEKTDHWPKYNMEEIEVYPNVRVQAHFLHNLIEDAGSAPSVYLPDSANKMVSVPLHYLQAARVQFLTGKSFKTVEILVASGVTMTLAKLDQLIQAHGHKPSVLVSQTEKFTLVKPGDKVPVDLKTHVVDLNHLRALRKKVSQLIVAGYSRQEITQMMCPGMPPF